MIAPIVNEIKPMSTEQLTAFVDAWVREHLPIQWQEAAVADDLAALQNLPQTMRDEWFELLGETGFAVPQWPVEHGGLGQDDGRSRIMRMVLDRYRASRPWADFVSLQLAGPTILTWGTDEQKERFLPGVVKSTERWCQLFSEPGAGSDLAVLSTRATRRADGSWAVTGQKVWSSLAQNADFGILLARTDPAQPKNRGITYFLLDMRSPGVDIRPIRQLTGSEHFSEVFLDEVVVPDSMRVGEIDAGWKVAMSTLSSERAGLSVSARGVDPTPGIWELAMTGEVLLDHMPGRLDQLEGAVESEIAQLLAQEHAIRLTQMRAAQDDGGSSDAQASVTKIARSELAQDFADLAVRLLPSGGATWEGDMPRTVLSMLTSRAYTIVGGTSEIQRNIIGERVMGLPREPATDIGKPWNEVPR